MADLDYYASYANVRNLLMNAALGTATSTLYWETSLELALSISQGYIHQYLGLENLTSTTNVVHVAVLKGIQIDLIMMRVLQARQMTENNLSAAGEIQSFWQMMPYLTNEHRRLLDSILDQMDGVAWTFDVNTGYEVSY